MEILNMKLEQLLAEFLSGFLEKVLNSKEYNRTGQIPDRFFPEYWKYLERFSGLQKSIEGFTSNSTEDSFEQKRALAMLKNSSGNIFETFSA